MQCFVINNEEIRGKRIDPSAYQMAVRREIEKLHASPYKLLPLKDVAEFGKEIITNSNSNPVYIGLENVESQTGVFVKSTEEKTEFGSALKFKKGDILFPKLRPYLNKVFLANFDGCCSTEFYVLNGKKVLNSYLSTFLSSQIVINQTSCLMTGNTLPRLQTADVENLLIPVPPIETQEKIVALMDKAHNSKKAMEDEAERLLSGIDDYVLGELGIKVPAIEEKKIFVLMSNEAENERINPQYHQPVFVKIIQSIKSGHFKVGNLGDLIKTIHYGASIQSDYQSEGISFLRITNISPNKIDLSNVVKINSELKKDLGNAFVKEGDFLISRSGSVGIVTLVPKEADGFAFGSFMIRFVMNRDEINKDYISIWLNNKAMQLLIERDKIGAIQGNITIDSIKNFVIPLPPLEIQNKIASEVKSRMQKAAKLKEEAKSLLQKAKDEVEKMILGN